MRRVHLFEWEDQAWLPTVFRDFITDHLRYTHNEPMREPINQAIAQRLARLMRETGTRRIVDLCSGAGGPVAKIGPKVAEELSEPIEVVVTDLYPNVGAFRALEARSGGLVRARYESTDAASVPADLAGIRTLFTAVHHFPPALVTRVLADAVRKRAPIAVFEPLERTLRMTSVVGLMSFLRGLTHTHRVGPLTIERFLVTYLLPVAPTMFAWDGSISALRSYTAPELRALADRAGQSGYEWEAGRFDVAGPFGQMPTTYLLGRPL